MQPHLLVERTLDVPAKAAYAILADYRDGHARILPRPPFKSLVVEQGGHGAGTRVRVDMRVMGRDYTFRLRVDEPEPGRVLREADEQGGVTTFTVEPVGDARCRVRIATTWAGPGGLRGWLDRKVKAALTRGVYERELAALEAAAKAL